MSKWPLKKIRKVIDAEAYKLNMSEQENFDWTLKLGLMVFADIFVKATEDLSLSNAAIQGLTKTYITDSAKLLLECLNKKESENAIS